MAALPRPSSPLQARGVLVLPGTQPPTLPPAAGSPPPSPFCGGRTSCPVGQALPASGLGCWAGCRFGRKGGKREEHGRGGTLTEKTCFYFQGESFGRCGVSFLKEDPADCGGQRATRKVGKTPRCWNAGPRKPGAPSPPPAPPVLAASTVSMCRS